MEILAEIAITVLGWVAELVLQLLLEVLAEFGLRVVSEPFRNRREISPFVAALGYALYGAVLGAVSLWLFPAPYLEADWLKWANLLVSPVAAGALMSLLGAWRRQRGQALMRLDRFSYGALFALSLALVRFFFAEAQ